MRMLSLRNTLRNRSALTSSRTRPPVQAKRVRGAEHLQDGELVHHMLIAAPILHYSHQGWTAAKLVSIESKANKTTCLLFQNFKTRLHEKVA